MSNCTVKRPRAAIACYRCHHKKVRCDGVHPNCTRCLSSGILCAYPTSRRSRSTQPTNNDPFIDNLSQLEARIRKIEADLENQRHLVQYLEKSTTVSVPVFHNVFVDPMIIATAEMPMFKKLRSAY